MALLGYNGGLRGKPRIPSTSNASGIWDLDEQKIAASAGIWPTAPDASASIPLQDIVYSKNEVWWSGFDPAYETPLGNLAFRDGVATSGGAVANDGYIKMDLGQAYMVEKIVIGSWHNGFTPPWAITNNCDILYSVNGTTWTTAFNLIGEFADVSIKEFDINVEARYIAIKRISSGDYAGVSEFYALAPGQKYDPYWANVSLLLHMDGSNGSTTFIDSSTNQTSITSYGGAQISTAQSKWGGSSGSFNGSTAYLDTTTQSPFILAGDFTVETWIYLNTSPAVYATIFCSKPTATNSGDFLLGAYNVVGTLRINADFNVGGFTGTTTSVTANTWTHVALVRNSGVISLFVNGIEDATTFTNLATLIPNQDGFARPILFGKDEMYGSTGNYFDGYIDDFRITKSVARYTSNFTPPTAPFPNF
jgi:hypothetical protein